MYQAMKVKNIKIKLAAAAMLLISISGLCLLIYYLKFKTLTNDDILAYGWKGGECASLPDVLDFRSGRLTLHNDDLYIDNKLIGRIVKREYRTYDDGRIDVLIDTGELCPFWAKWKNKR